MKINKVSKIALKEYQEKMAIKKRLQRYYAKETTKNGLKSLSKIARYLPDTYKDIHLRRNILFSHLDMEPIIELIAKGDKFAVVSGLNPSSPLHLGHKVLFDYLLELQKLGGEIFIPITNDETFADDKTSSIEEARKKAYEDIIPSILAFGFNPEQTHIFVDTDYLPIYRYALELGKSISLPELNTVFGQESLKNVDQVFYRGGVQLAHILLPQMPEFGGLRHTLIPVGIDQHPYILLARDIAKKQNLTPPSEAVIKFAPSLKNPEEKMSGSKPDTAIYLSDSPEQTQEKISKAFTGAVSELDAHRQLGAVPEACSVFALLYYHHPDEEYVKNVYKKYKKGILTTRELKEETTKFIIQLVNEHNTKKQAVKNDLEKYLLRGGEKDDSRN